MAQPPKDPSASAADRGSEARLARLVHEQFAFIWRLLRRVGLSEPEADAGVEEVFDAASQRIADIRQGSERSFLFSTALHVAARVRRSRGEPSAISDEALALEELEGAGQAREILGGILEQMPLELRVVFVLRDIEQVEEDEIADLVGIPIGTTRTRVVEAREDFATHLDTESELSLSLLAAAREEQPTPAARTRVLLALGVEALDAARAASERLDSSASRRVRAAGARRSPFGLSLKWLLLGWVLGLIGASVVFALSEPHARSGAQNTQTR